MYVAAINVPAYTGCARLFMAYPSHREPTSPPISRLSQLPRLLLVLSYPPVSASGPIYRIEHCAILPSLFPSRTIFIAHFPPLLYAYAAYGLHRVTRDFSSPTRTGITVSRTTPLIRFTGRKSLDLFSKLYSTRRRFRYRGGANDTRRLKLAESFIRD